MRLRRVEDTHSRSQPQAEVDIAEYERLIREATRDSRQVRPHSIEFVATGHTVNHASFTAVVGKRWCGKCHFSCCLPVSDDCNCDGLGLSCDALTPFPNQ